MESLLQVTGLSKKFGETIAVNGIGFKLEQGRCTALLGPNGAGKTTTLRMLTGLLSPTEGRIQFTGSQEEDVRTQIGYLPQDPVFFNWMTGREFMELTGKLFRLEKREIRSRTDELLERMGIREAANRRIGGYSGGMKQRLGFAHALIHRPRLLILDEPVSALDPVGRRQMLEIMKEIRQETTILFSTHVLHDAEELSDDILIMKNGTIAVSGGLEDLRKEHRKPIILVEAETPLDAWAKRVERMSFVRGLECSGGRLRVGVTDAAEARRVLLADLAASDIPVVRFEASHTTLEDLFFKVVGA